MHTSFKLALGAAVPALFLAGCSDWLTSSQAARDPNNPSTASPNALLTAIEVAQTTIQTGDLARTFSLWMQSMAGTDRQAIPLDLYQYDEDWFAGDWPLIYTGGGLIDERTLQAQTIATNDSVYAGIGKVLEALTIGTAADVWGDIPYSQAVSDSLTPKLDPQQDVYAAVQAKLDTAITFLKCATPGVCAGPGSADIWYNGDPTLWLELAHTLKARYYLHVAEREGRTAYEAALAQADSGISDPSHDLRSYHSTDPNEWNLWYQFMVIQRSGYIGAGAFMVNLLKSTNDPRLPEYYSRNTAGEFVGAPPGGGGLGDVSSVSDTRLNPAFRQPMVTFAENQLIRAEAALQTGNASAALAAYNAERRSQGVPEASGSVTLQQIITEKYIALFQQIEPWNDYKRTCLPALTPAQPTGVPGRVLYPLSTERNANPNVPPPGGQSARNWNDPNPCP